MATNYDKRRNKNAALSQAQDRENRQQQIRDNVKWITPEVSDEQRAIRTSYSEVPNLKEKLAKTERYLNKYQEKGWDKSDPKAYGRHLNEKSTLEKAISSRSADLEAEMTKPYPEFYDERGNTRGPTPEEIEALSDFYQEQGQTAMDNDLEMEIASLLGPRSRNTVDIDRVTEENFGRKERPNLNLKGHYIPYRFSGDPRDTQKRLDGVRSDVTEPGDIKVFGEGMNKATLAHEFSHKADDLAGVTSSENSNRLKDGFTANDDESWEQAVSMWRDWKNEDGYEPYGGDWGVDLARRIENNEEYYVRKENEANPDWFPTREHFEGKFKEDHPINSLFGVWDRDIDKERVDWRSNKTGLKYKEVMNRFRKQEEQDKREGALSEEN